MGCIYAHILKDETSEHYNWWYIGQAESISRRWGKEQISNYKGSPFIYSALRKYGWKAFDHIILEDNIDKERLNEREIYWIAKYHTFIGDPEYKQGFNLTSGGDGSRGPKLPLRGVTPKNVPMLAEMKLKPVTVANSGKWNGKDFSKNQTWNSIKECAEYFGVTHSSISWRLANINKLQSGPIFITKDNIEDFNIEELKKNKKHEKTRQKEAGAALALVHTTGSKIEYVIHCVETGQNFAVVSDCLRAFGMSRSTLNGHLNYPDKHKTAKGYHFKRIPKTEADS